MLEVSMSVPLLCIGLAFVVTLLSKAPVAVAMARKPGGYDNRHPRDQQASLDDWGRRAVAAHLNSFEAFPGFAAAVLVAHLAGGDPAWSTVLAVTFLVARVLYVPCYLANWHILRSSVWTVGFAATLALFALPLL
jgi:uncharacterized MAPEG superfamily protein